MPYAVTLLRPRVSATLALGFRDLGALSGTDLPDNPAHQDHSITQSLQEPTLGAAYPGRPTEGTLQPASARTVRAPRRVPRRLAPLSPV
jgi:hypothetical protein